MPVLVSDTSVLIDLERGSFLEPVFRLPFEFAVPDLLYERELRDHGGPTLIDLGLRLEELDGAGVTLALAYRRARRSLYASRQLRARPLQDTFVDTAFRRRLAARPGTRKKRRMPRRPMAGRSPAWESDAWPGRLDRGPPANRRTSSLPAAPGRNPRQAPQLFQLVSSLN